MGQAISFKNRMGRTLTQVSKENWGKAPQEKAKEKRDLSKNQRKRDFDETHNSGLEKQSKEEVNSL